MKILLLNTSDTGGGAAVACSRLQEALTSQGAEVKMLVQQQMSHRAGVIGLLKGFWGRLQSNFNFLAERLPFLFFHEKDKSVRFAFSTAPTGSDISRHPLVQEADILHLHWTNRGFLSVSDLKKLMALGKPVVWTLHDMWAFTGGCHYAGDCEHYLQQCGNCPMLKNPTQDDISHRGWQQKKDLLEGINNLQFVTCSNWLAQKAKSSSLLSAIPVETIPNPIDTSIYCPKDPLPIREKWGIASSAKVLLFGAANINDKRKGLTYLLDALHYYHQHYQLELKVVIFGKNTSFDPSAIPFKVHSLPLMTSEKDLVELYNLADVFVQPSLEDNLPNMVMESMACGRPVLAFQTGGLPDLVTHQQNGYLAEYRSVADFAKGIDWLLQHPAPLNLQQNAREKVLQSFHQEVVAKQYLQLYQSLLKPHA